MLKPVQKSIDVLVSLYVDIHVNHMLNNGKSPMDSMTAIDYNPFVPHRALRRYADRKAAQGNEQYPSIFGDNPMTPGKIYDEYMALRRRS